MAILPIFAVPDIPRAEPFSVGRPPRAADVQRLQGVCTHLEDWRFRGCTRAAVEVDASACPAVISGDDSTPRFPPGPHNLTEITRVPHYLRSDAAHLWVAIRYQASPEGTSSPEITLQLYTLGGVLLERGCTWSAAAGDLPTDRQHDAGMLAATGLTSWVYPPLWITTPLRVDDDARTAGTPSLPRLLSLAGCSPRTRVEVRITAVAARIVGVTAWEWPENPL